MEAVLRKLQPRAKLIRTVKGQVDAAEILNTGLFDFEEASRSAGWIAELTKPVHTPETEEYGISSFVYERVRPFHPERLKSWMEDWPEQVVRSKGTVWLASRNDIGQSLSQAGPSIQFGPAGYWVASLPTAERESLLAEEPELADNWHPEYGDRINKVVLIGIDMDRQQLTSELDACLLNDEEMGRPWDLFRDEFPQAADPAVL